MKKISSSIFILIVISLYIILLFMYKKTFPISSTDNTDWGTFGDYIGGSLSPIIGIIGIVFTYNIINNQNIENRQQEFKYMFQILFDAITQKKEIIESTKRKSTKKGHAAFPVINRDIESVWKFKKKQSPSSDPVVLFREAFWSVFEDINHTSAAYMKNLHNCLKIVNKNCIDDRRREYADLIRAQLSPEELIFVFYNSLASDTFASFRSNLEKFSILKDISNQNLDPILMALIDKKAFEDEPEDCRKIAFYKKNFSFEIKINFKRN